MTNSIKIILALFKAIPALKEIWDQLISTYLATQIENIKKEYREAIRKAIYEHDQRDLESSIGSPQSGKASGVPGAVIVDNLGMHPQTER